MIPANDAFDRLRMTRRVRMDVDQEYLDCWAERLGVSKELLRLITIPEEQSLFEMEISAIIRWYNEHCPHETLDGKTPNEVYFSREAANEQPRLEPRPRWPRGSPCAKAQVGIDGEPGDLIVLEIDCLNGRRHLPIIRARRAA